MRWQCRLRQIAMRKGDGRPNAGMMPQLHLADAAEPLGSIATVLSRLPRHSVTLEFMHMARRTYDPAEQRSSAIKFLSENYYQHPSQFSPQLTSTFAPQSSGATTIAAAQQCILHFEQFNQSYELVCRVTQLSDNNPLFESTYWHNLLFNPSLTRDCMILGFEPLWGESRAEPSPV